MRYKSRYEQRHPALSDTGEVEMINSYKPTQCPYCLSSQLAKKGYDANGAANADRYFVRLRIRYLTPAKFPSANGWITA